MSRYIDADRLINDLLKSTPVDWENYIVKVQEIKRGRWRLTRDGQMEYKVCSVCAERTPLNQWRREWESAYCPNCGAKMDEVEE